MANLRPGIDEADAYNVRYKFIEVEGAPFAEDETCNKKSCHSREHAQDFPAFVAATDLSVNLRYCGQGAIHALPDMNGARRQE
jgi:hypothetical protein